MTEEKNKIQKEIKVDRENKNKNNKTKKYLFNKSCKNCLKIKQECVEYKQGWQRALADYKNLQKEIDKRKGEWIKMSEITVLEEFLPVYEYLKMAVNGAKEKQESGAWIEGVQFVLKQFQNILLQHGVEEIKTIGEQFDPMYHEAISEEKIDNKKNEEIVKELSTGYKINNKVLKAARVVVNKNN